MTDVWKRVMAEVASKPEAADKPVAWLSERLGMKIARVNNWAARGVPSNVFPDIARVLGWSLDDVAGTSTPDGRPPWPFNMVDRDRWDKLTQQQRGYVQKAINVALDECERSGKPAPNFIPHEVQLDTPNVRVAHTTSAPEPLTRSPEWEPGIGGKKSDSTSSKTGGVASKAHSRGATRPAGKGGAR